MGDVSVVGAAAVGAAYRHDHAHASVSEALAARLFGELLPATSSAHIGGGSVGR